MHRHHGRLSADGQKEEELQEVAAAEESNHVHSSKQGPYRGHFQIEYINSAVLLSTVNKVHLV